MLSSFDVIVLIDNRILMVVICSVVKFFITVIGFVIVSDLLEFFFVSLLSSLLAAVVAVIGILVIPSFVSALVSSVAASVGVSVAALVGVSVDALDNFCSFSLMVRSTFNLYFTCFFFALRIHAYLKSKFFSS